MSAHLGKIALMIVMTHGFRTLGRLSNPRWAGLALGLPCSTAVTLVGSGLDRGVDYAVAMSSTSLIGLAGAVALPMAYARAIGRGWRLPWAILIGALTYLMIAISAARMLPSRGDASLGIAIVAVVGAIWAANRIPLSQREPESVEVQTSLSNRILRTIVPIACLRGSLAAGDFFGAEVGGLMSTFPGVTLTVLLFTHLDTGSSSAVRMARVLPVGNLGTLGFLACFRFVCPVVGLVWGTILGYVATLVILALVLALGLNRKLARERFQTFHARICRLIVFDRRMDDARLSRSSWPRAGRRFSPFVERLAA